MARSTHQAPAATLWNEQSKTNSPASVTSTSPLAFFKASMSLSMRLSASVAAAASLAISAAAKTVPLHTLSYVTMFIYFLLNAKCSLLNSLVSLFLSLFLFLWLFRDYPGFAMLLWVHSISNFVKYWLILLLFFPSLSLFRIFRVSSSSGFRATTR